ncbi:MAG: outer membrane beta-barrel protein [Pseudomonadota bacterium]
MRRALPLVVMCAGTPVAAEEDGFYFGGFLGAGDSVTARTDFIDGGDPGRIDYDLDTPLAGGFVVGWQSSTSLRSELEFSLSGAQVSATTLDTATLAPTIEASDGDVQVTYLMANGWVDVPLTRGINPYVGGGLGVAHVSGDATRGGGPLVLGSDSGLAAQVGAGLRFPTAIGGAIDIAYRFKTVTGADLDQTGSSFTTDGEFSSHSLNIGYIFNF